MRRRRAGQAPSGEMPGGLAAYEIGGRNGKARIDK